MPATGLCLKTFCGVRRFRGLHVPLERWHAADESVSRAARRKRRKAMRPRSPEFRFLIHPFDRVIAIFCAALLFLAANSTALAQQAQSQVMTTTTTDEAPKIPNDQLDSLVAP